MNPTIKNLEFSDLELICQLQPPDWSDVMSRFREHFGQDYYYPVKAVVNNTLVGIGQLMLNRETAWLGNIIVHPDFRKRGIGRLVTLHLMGEAINRGKKLQLLLATLEGAPLYEKLGFVVEGEYHFFKKEPKFIGIHDIPYHIFIYQDKFLEAILALDAAATGEDRSAILQRFLPDSHVYLNEEKEVEGFYMPGLGEGLVVANTPRGGTSLVRLREMQGNFYNVIPTQSGEALRYLHAEGYQYFRKAILMRYGEMKSWKPEMIYSRVGGYLG